MGSYFGQGNGPIFFSNVLCQGSESSLLDCNFDRVVPGECSHGNDAGVTCQCKCYSVS